jgi:hypothetical protein
VTVPDIYDGMTKNFHSEGLFSTETFGRVGDDDRSKRFAYIDMGTYVLHPTVYKELVKLKALYRGILSGKSYAKWDAKEKDFVRSDELEGSTGYSFFMSKWKDIKFRKTSSDVRTLKIDLIEKFRTESLVRYMVVIPAGLRDIEVDEHGRTSEDEINSMYRKVLSISNSIAHTSEYTNDSTQDTARWSLQLAFLEIYETLRAMLEGKKGFIQAKWSSRKIQNGTRNVISAMSFVAPSSTDPKLPKANDTITGLYQFMKGTLPLMIHGIKNSVVGESFNDTDSNVMLVDKKTLKPVPVQLSNKVRDQWFTVEGLEKTVDHYKNIDLRHKPLMISGYYGALIYDNGSEYRILKDIDELPEGRNKEDVRPITWAEFFYVIAYKYQDKTAGLVTRYPITGIGSIYPTLLKLKTTVVGNVRQELGPDWQPIEGMVAYEMPVHGESHVESMAVHVNRIDGARGLNADYDGDMTSLNILYGDESVKEIHDLMKTKVAYLDPRGGFQQQNSDPLEWTLLNMTA